MGKSKIEWTEKVWNPVTGCTKVSDGCKYCYADRMFPMVYGNTVILDEFEIVKARKFTDIKYHEDRLEQPLRWKKPSMIFVCSMGDLFHEDVPFDFIAKVFNIMEQCPQHTFQVLTKRPERMKEFYESDRESFRKILEKYLYDIDDSSLKNVWIGVSAENQKTADERIPILLEIPAKVRFISVEPMLEFIDLDRGIDSTPVEFWLDKIDWVIVGAESGPKRRLCKMEWVFVIVRQCKSANVPVFVKQLHWGPKNKFLEKDISRFPEYLRLRQYPK